MDGKMIFTLLGVVCAYSARGAAPAGERGAPGPGAGAAPPEVLLQLRYERGALARVYLAQFRAAPARPPARPPALPRAVPAASRLCADLCHAGLGGEACGAGCSAMAPLGLAAALRSQNGSAARRGEPRVRVCPALCANRLGAPLCGCPTAEEPEQVADWEAVCEVFCQADGYVLGGCPACKETSIPTDPVALTAARLLDTSEGWASWCNVQCHQGHGGAACNCDRAPFQ